MPVPVLPPWSPCLPSRRGHDLEYCNLGRGSAILFLLWRVDAVIAEINGQAVDLFLYRHVSQLSEMRGIVFLKDRNRAVVAGDINALQPGVERNHISTLSLR